MTTLTYLGHASFFFETDAAAILIDPWFSPRGAFLGAWRQLPPNHHCLQWVREKMREKPVLIYVTHEHEDHYDEETLRELLPLAKGLCVPDYENSFLRNLINKNLNILPQLVRENEPVKFHDVQYRIFIDESGINRDSAIFLQSDGLSFLDVNDCKIYDRAEWISKNCGPLDFVSGQFSGANMHPICYDMPPSEYQRISNQKRMRKFVAVRNFLKELKPKYYLPSAGPALFPFQQHEHLNFEADNIFPKWWEFESFLKSKKDEIEFVALDVLGSVSTYAEGFRMHGLADRLSDAEVSRFIDDYRKIDADNCSVSSLPVEEVFSYFEREMSQKLDVLKQNTSLQFPCPLYFEIRENDGGATIYGIRPGQYILEKGTSKNAITAPYYLHSTTVDAIGRLMQSGKGWGTYFLSFLFKSKRVPDAFDTVMGNFFVANDAADLDFGLKKLIQFRDSNEYISLISGDGQVTVKCKRFCPHQGADLKYARFDGRYVVCPRHQWRFDCEMSGKADNCSDSIDAAIVRKAAV